VELLDWIEERDVSDAHDGGIMKKILKEGEGYDKPREDWKVKANLIGRVMHEDGNSSIFEEKNNFEFEVGAEEVVVGLDQAVQKFRKGEKALLTIKPQYAFGEAGNPPLNVPPNATVQYEVELVDFVKEKDSWDMTVDEKFETAERKKQEGNELYQQGKVARALKKYKRALDLFEYDSNLTDEQKDRAKKLKVSCYLNTAACHMKDKEYKKVIENCNKALDIDRTNIKALFRKGSCLVDLDEWDEGQRSLERAAELDPNNKDVKRELLRLKKKRQEQDKKDKQFFSTIFQKLAKEGTKQQQDLKPLQTNNDTQNQDTPQKMDTEPTGQTN
jgi:FK506-binding protein 4/5